MSFNHLYFQIYLNYTYKTKQRKSVSVWLCHCLKAEGQNVLSVPCVSFSSVPRGWLNYIFNVIYITAHIVRPLLTK